MKYRFWALLFVATILCVSSCADDFETRINRGDTSSGGEEVEVALSGVVKDDAGNPVSGVLVSDGGQTTVTDADGRYQLYSDLSLRRFVYITIPAEYEIPVKQGIPQFWKQIPQGAESFEADFTLKRRTAAADRYTVLMVGDPQIRGYSENTDNLMFHSTDIYKDLCADEKAYAATITDRPVYSVVLGDMVHNKMDLWEEYCAGIEDFTFPVFHTIGNHDHIQKAKTDDEAIAYFEKHLGPTNYAVELGRLHFIFLDNIIMEDNSNLTGTSTGEYKAGLSNDIVEWLRGHLKHVDKDKILMLCTHSSLYKKVDANPAETNVNASVYTGLLAPYKFVHTWAGHNHNWFNYAYAAEEPGSQYANVESHVVGRSTGMLGLNAEVAGDGVPRGYLVVDVDGEKITWKFRPYASEYGVELPLSPDKQLRAYRPYEGGYYADSKVYVNVWAYDAHWGPVYYTDSGKNKVEMTPEVTHDGYANSLYLMYKDRYSPLKYTIVPHLFSVEPSAGAKEAQIETTDRFGNTWSTSISWE